MLEDAQQMIPMKIALHPRRIVVDAERQIGCVRNVKKKALDVILGGTDIGGCRQDRAVSTVIHGKTYIRYGGLRIVAGCAEEDRHARRLHLGGLDNDVP